MTRANDDWEKRISELWAAIDDHDENEFVMLVDGLVGELPPGNAVGLFERAATLDSTGHSALAIPLYKAALDAGLVGVRRRRAIIQMASSLRNIGQAQGAVALLTAELDGEADALTGNAGRAERYGMPDARPCQGWLPSSPNRLTWHFRL